MRIADWSHPDSVPWEFRGALELACTLFIALWTFGPLSATRVLAEPAPAPATTVNGTTAVQAVDVIGMTVEDMDRSVEFFTKVLRFEKTSDVEVTGIDYERLQGLFGLRMRVVRMKLGDESLELTEYLAPRGRPFPVDTRSNDRWFQHVAIIVSDMDDPYRTLRQHKVQHASSGPQRLPDWNEEACGIQAFYFEIPTAISSKFFSSQKAKAILSGSGQTSCSWESITPRSW